MKKRISAIALSLLILCALIPTFATAANIDDFTDVKQGSWYYEAVNHVVEKALFTGTSATKFSPNTPMTRAMFVTVLGRNAKADTSRYSFTSFADVQVSTWYGPYVEWAHCNSIVHGTSGTKFAPDASITREQIATILYRYAEATGSDVTYSDGLFNGFPDAGSVSAYAKTALKWATYHKIINGSGGKILPKKTATRAEVAQMFYNASGILENSTLLNEKCPEVKPTPTPAPSGLVYWSDTKDAKSYHSTKDCATLKRSKTILSGSVDDAKFQGKGDPCNVCVK